MDKPHSSVIKSLLWAVSFWYLAVGLVITVTLSGYQYFQARSEIEFSMVKLGNSFVPGLSNAVWTYDNDFLASNLQGLLHNQDVAAVKVRNNNNEEIHSYKKGAAENQFLPAMAPLRFPLWITSRKEKRIDVGLLIIHPSARTLEMKLRLAVGYAVVYTVLSLLFLGLGVLYLGHRILTRPLTLLARSIERVNPDKDNNISGLTPNLVQGEIRLVVDVVNNLLSRNMHLRKAERGIRERLEELVEERTSDLQEANKKLEELSRRDGLTGLYNRRMFDQCLDREWSRARRSGESITLIMCDIDFFKRYNDTYGHIAGDDCIRLAARTIETHLKRSMDIATRYGGEEFAVILPGTNLQGGTALAESIRAALAEKALEHSQSPHGVLTMSFGVASAIPCANGYESLPESLVTEADAALYASKNTGRNRVTPAEG